MTNARTDSTAQTFTLNQSVEISGPLHPEVVGAENTELTFPLTAEDTQPFVSEEGFITVVVPIDQETYFVHHTSGVGYDISDSDQFDLAHHTAFSFGMPSDCHIEIIAADAERFIIRYTTFIAEHIDEELDS